MQFQPGWMRSGWKRGDSQGCYQVGLERERAFELHRLTHSCKWFFMCLDYPSVSEFGFEGMDF